MRRIVLAPDSFKQSLTAQQAAEAMRRGVLHALGEEAAQCDMCPIADGGEGTLEALVGATAGRAERLEVVGPTGEPVEASWGQLGDAVTGVVEMAQAAGLGLVDEALRNPAKMTTYGVGQLIGAALDGGCQELIVAIGGSATNDGGAGMAQALGVKFLNRDGAVIQEPMTAARLEQVTQIDLSGLDQRLTGARISVACDVTNPLTGPRGAAAVYGPQKGATPSQIVELDAAMNQLAKYLKAAGVQVDPNAPGMGAAGGLGFGLVAFCGAELKRGIDLVLEAVNFESRARGADLVLTGEGRLDGQSVEGKACLGVAQAAGRVGVETIALVGSVGEGVEKTLKHGLESYHPLCDGNITEQRAMAEAAPLLEALTAKVIGQM